MYKEKGMQRTQIYFEQETLVELKTIANNLNISVSQFIRQVMNVEIKKQKKKSLNGFLKNMKPLESFSDIDATDYVKGLREKSRIIGE